MSDARAGASDAFALSANPATYVPSPGRERALAQLIAALEAGAVPCLEGPTGIGKTMLLQLLARRVAGRFAALYLPYPLLTTRELCALAIGLLGRRDAGDPEAALQGVAADLAARGRPLLLLVDDAGSLPADSAQGLAALRAASHGALLIVLAGIAGEGLRRATAAFGDTLLRVALEEGIPETGLRDYVAAQLERAHAPPSLRAAFDDHVLEELGRVAAGNPRRLHLAAQTIVRRAESAGPPAPDESAPHEPTPEPARAAPIAAPPLRLVEPEAPAPIAASAPARAAEPAGPVAPPATGEVPPFGEYRVVRGRLVHSHAEGARESAAQPTAPARIPPAQIDLTLAARSRSGPEPAGARRPASVAASRAASSREVTAEPSRRGPSLLAVVAVAIVSAGVGFALASRMESEWEQWVARAPSEPTAAPVPREPAQPSAAPAAPVSRMLDEPAPPIPAAPADSAPAAPPAATLEISINATPWAIVEVDDRELGETPLGGVRVSPGTHRFRARFPDGRVIDRTLEIDAAHRTLVFE